jgi:hypothetical protein
MDLTEIPEKIGVYAGIAAFIGIALVFPLYYTQARDIRRLRTWMLLTPEIGVAEREAAEAARLTEAVADAPPAPPPAAKAPEAPAPAAPPPAPPPEPGAPAPVPEAAPPVTPPPAPAPSATPRHGVTPVPGSTPPRPLTPAERIALDRPATARITGERAVVTAPQKNGGLRRFIRRPSERGLAGIVAGALILSIGVVFVVLQAGEEAPDDRRARAPKVIPSEVEVAVLNGTATPDLAAKVGDDIVAGDFELGTITNSETPYDRTTVMFEPGSETEAEAVAQELGVQANVVAMDAETRALVDGAQVAVIAGVDRAQ